MPAEDAARADVEFVRATASRSASASSVEISGATCDSNDFRAFTFSTSCSFRRFNSLAVAESDPNMVLLRRILAV